MALRQIKQFHRSRPSVLGSLVQPLLFLFALGLGFRPVFEQASNMDYVQYLTPGIVGMSFLFGSMINSMSLIWDKQFGFLKETLIAPAPRIKLLIGRCLGGATTAMIQEFVVFFVNLFIGYRSGHHAVLPLFIMVMFIMALLFSLL